MLDTLRTLNPALAMGAAILALIALYLVRLAIRPRHKWGR